MLEVERLLIEVNAISKRYEQIARITGENFNIFKTLGLQSSEVRLHSAFLAEFLNAKGSHGQSDKYLQLFIDHVKLPEDCFQLSDFDSISSEAVVEYHSGAITEDGEQGGRFDILITDHKGRHIIIENKIYAGDQSKQLKRYKGFDTKSALFYLNLFGNAPSQNSCDGLILNVDYKIISYQTDIILWLEMCMKESVVLPIIRETIHQYINLIKVLTNQAIMNEMDNELKELIKHNPAYFKSIPIIYSAYQNLITELKDEFFEKLHEKLSIGEYELTLKEDKEYTIQLQAGEGSEGFFFAFRLAKTGQNIRFNLTRSQIVTQGDNPELFNLYAPFFTKDFDRTFKKTPWSLAWYYPADFGTGFRLEEINPELLLSLLDNDKMDSFIDKIFDEAGGYLSQLKAKVA